MQETDKRQNRGSDESDGVHSAASFDELCALASRLLAVDAAVVVLNQSGLSRIIASCGLKIAMRSINWDLSAAPYQPDEPYILCDARSSVYAQQIFHECSLPVAGAFIRIPLEVTASHSLSLVLLGAEPIQKPSMGKLKLLSEIGDLLRQEFSSTIDLLTDPSSDVTVPKTLAEVRGAIDQMHHAAFLLDANLKIVHGNRKASEITNLPVSGLIGLTHKQLAPDTGDAVHFLYDYALKTMVSPPDFEVIIDDGMPRIFRMNVTPFSPIDTRDYFLSVNVEETTHIAVRALALTHAVDQQHPLKLPKDPSQIFLMETLVKRRSIRHRKNTSFVVLRAWRQSIKPYQITAFKALKQNIPPEFPHEIAKEISGEVQSLFGISGFKAIVPMPCGHSKPNNCLSLEIARALGLLIGLPVIQAFIHEPVNGVSHPKENTKRPPMKMTRIITEPVLLIDDVATSGAHIEEAVALLKPMCGAVLPIAWLGGDVAQSEITRDDQD